MKRKRWSGQVRLQILEAHDHRCYLSGQRIDPVRDSWHLDHKIPLAGGGEDTIENLAPVLLSAHLEKTKADIARISKGKRVRLNHFGAKPKPSRPMPGSRRSKWKKTFSHGWVPR